jgi:hypothetical protein
VAFEELETLMDTCNANAPVSDDLWFLFKSVVHRVANCRFVLDGFDECLTQDDNRAHFSGARSRFLTELLRSIQSSTATILITSRNEVDIREGLGLGLLEDTSQVATYGVTAHDTEADLGVFAHSIVSERLPDKDQSFKEEIAHTLSSKAQGMFLWVRLEKEWLKKSNSPSQLRRLVQDMPSGVHLLQQTYEVFSLNLKPARIRRQRTCPQSSAGFYLHPGHCQLVNWYMPC